MLNRPPIEMLDAGQQSGDIVSSGNGLTVEVDDENIATEFKGHYDPVIGVLSLEIPGYPRIRFTGFLTNRDLKEGRQGADGEAGTNGIAGLDGTDGDQGHRGCIGPKGPRGLPGQRGPRGQRGVEGKRGVQGEQGERGDPGQLMMFFQKEDPGPVGASAIWVKI